MTGQPSASMAARSWVASRAGAPAHRSFKSAAARAMASGSRPVKGSSKKRLSALAHTARSRAARRFCPPESFAAGTASASPAMPRRAKSASTPARAARPSGRTSRTFSTAVSWGQSLSS